MIRVLCIRVLGLGLGLGLPGLREGGSLLCCLKDHLLQSRLRVNAFLPFILHPSRT